ncbi:MAG: PEGA domain-containing protein [Candidatus Staskawiczbacteria bacterium]|nr:PEGA domain-containing protein [Candidatus Staskawiczbacteria bacterium]
MTKKSRLIILLVCVVCFFVVAPMLVAYSMGYRYDFEKNKIVATGGIYVRTFPSAGQITIDSNISQKPGFLANSIFVQSLLPKNHTVSIKKDGYYDYFKTLPVKENEVTKLENVLLIKNSIGFKNLADKVDYFSIAPNNQNIITATTNAKNITFSYFSLGSTSPAQTFSIIQTEKISDIKWSNDSTKALINIQNSGNNFYYLFDTAQVVTPLKKLSAVRLPYLDKTTQQVSFNPQNSKELFFVKNKILYSAINNKTLAVIKNLNTYKFSSNNITWLSADGSLYSSDIAGKLIEQLTVKNIAPIPTQNYQIFILPGKTLLQADNFLFVLNQDKKTLEDITPPETNYKIIDSLDENKNLNLIFWNSSKIYLYSFADKKFTELFSGTDIKNCQWINNGYIIFNDNDKIIISEIDYRGNINAITLSKTAPDIYFNPQDGKLYILANNTLSSSDKITP